VVKPPPLLHPWHPAHHPWHPAHNQWHPAHHTWHAAYIRWKPRYDLTCWDAGSDMASRDASCYGSLVCARSGWDGRKYGDCPQRHCCSVPPRRKWLARYDKTCWTAGSDIASRDAACMHGLVCARKGFDNRDFGIVHMIIAAPHPRKRSACSHGMPPAGKRAQT
jgi:hypothetical protein